MSETAHYYGDMVRKIFLICGLVILITLPFLKSNISSPTFYSVVVILVLTFLAGMTNPRLRVVIVGDVVVSLISFCVFAFEAITKFTDLVDLLFITNLTLAILFLFAFYWSVKSLRNLSIMNEPLTDEAIFETNPEEKLPVVSEDSLERPKIELSEEERRRKRFLQSDE